MPEIDASAVLAVPIADFASSVARGVANAQRELDQASYDLWKQLETDPLLKPLLEIGYQPTWYVIPEAEAEIKLFFHFESETASTPGRLLVLPFNATIRSKTSLREEGTSQLRLKIVPLPPPQGLAAKEKK